MGRRIAATLIDGFLVYLSLFVLIFAFSFGGIGENIAPTPTVFIALLFWFAVSTMTLMPLLFLHEFSPVWFLAAVGIWMAYATVMEYAVGWTVGKRLTGIVVKTTGDDRGPPSAVNVLVRNLLRLLDGLLGYGVGFVVAVFSSRRQRVGDYLGGTVVLRIDPELTPLLSRFEPSSPEEVVARQDARRSRND